MTVGSQSRTAAISPIPRRRSVVAVLACCAVLAFVAPVYRGSSAVFLKPMSTGEFSPSLSEILGSALLNGSSPTYSEFGASDGWESTEDPAPQQEPRVKK